MNARLFIDFWNFSINWKTRTDGAKTDWKALPSVHVTRQPGRARKTQIVSAHIRVAAKLSESDSFAASSMTIHIESREAMSVRGIPKRVMCPRSLGAFIFAEEG